MFRSTAIRLSAALAVSALVQGLAVAATTLSPLTGGGPALTQTSYDATVISFDGTPIEITVFVPNAPANTPVPLMINGNPWGGHRLETLPVQGLINKAFFTESEAAAQTANENGYFLISYDERGWGDSGGVDELMSPGYEGKDLQAILDWAQDNLGPQLAYRNGQLVAGMEGWSYGGANQLMGASLDPRISVIVPALTWNSLVTSLAPGLPTPQPKGEWSSLLLLTAEFMGATLNPSFKTDMQDAANGEVDPGLIQMATPNGPNAYCSGGVDPNPGQSLPTIPVFLVQGWADTLFSANQAVANAQCLRQSSPDVRLLIQQYGHSLPFSQKIPNGDGIIGVAMQDQITCGTQTFKLSDAMYSFVDQYIRGPAASGPSVNVPQTCVTLDDSSGLVLDSIPVGNTSFTIVSTSIKRTTFIPLYTVTTPRALAGIPHLTITITADKSDEPPYAYFGIGVKRKGSLSDTLLDDQVLPIQGAGSYDADMIGVAASLNAGDVVGVIADVSSSQYDYGKISRKAGNYSVSGTFSLPFAD